MSIFDLYRYVIIKSLTLCKAATKNDVLKDFTGKTPVSKYLF